MGDACGTALVAGALELGTVSAELLDMVVIDVVNGWRSERMWVSCERYGEWWCDGIFVGDDVTTHHGLYFRGFRK